MPAETLVRRPLKSRDTGWANYLAQLLIRFRLRPNSISVLSILFAAAAGACFLLLNRIESVLGQALVCFIIACCIELRLLCNLMDGMVAVEGGARSASGEVFNELPDRISDILVLIPIGYAIPSFPAARELSWLAGLLALITAYVRALGGSLGMPQDFSGPMAKPQRMAAIAVASLASLVEIALHHRGNVLYAALIVVAVGSIVTVIRRTVRLIRWLEAR